MSSDLIRLKSDVRQIDHRHVIAAEDEIGIIGDNRGYMANIELSELPEMLDLLVQLQQGRFGFDADLVERAFSSG